jgi:hypothetical protein
LTNVLRPARWILVSILLEKHMAEAKIRIGKELAKGKVDASKIGKGRKPSTAEVEAQSVNWCEGHYTCWNCWSLNVVDPDTVQWLGFACWNCGAWMET